MHTPKLGGEKLVGQECHFSGRDLYGARNDKPPYFTWDPTLPPTHQPAFSPLRPCVYMS